MPRSRTRWRWWSMGTATFVVAFDTARAHRVVDLLPFDLSGSHRCSGWAAPFDLPPPTCSSRARPRPATPPTATSDDHPRRLRQLPRRCTERLPGSDVGLRRIWRRRASSSTWISGRLVRLHRTTAPSSPTPVSRTPMTTASATTATTARSTPPRAATRCDLDGDGWGDACPNDSERARPARRPRTARWTSWIPAPSSRTPEEWAPASKATRAKPATIDDDCDVVPGDGRLLVEPGRRATTTAWGDLCDNCPQDFQFEPERPQPGHDSATSARTTRAASTTTTTAFPTSGELATCASTARPWPATTTARTTSTRPQSDLNNDDESVTLARTDDGTGQRLRRHPRGQTAASLRAHIRREKVGCDDNCPDDFNPSSERPQPGRSRRRLPGRPRRPRFSDFDGIPDDGGPANCLRTARSPSRTAMTIARRCSTPPRAT